MIRTQNSCLKKINEYFLLIAILSAGSFLRFYRLGYKSLWADEGITWILAKFDVPSHGHPHLYFTLVGYFIKIFGESEFTLRLLSTLSGIGILILSYIITRNLFSVKTATLQTLILSFSTVSIFSSQNMVP